jgi:phosphohistidine swiveling domain-containing protein
MAESRHKSTILFADDKVIVSNSTDDNLQPAIYKLNKIINEYGLTVSTDKSQVMAFKGRDQTRSKIVINNKII